MHILRENFNKQYNVSEWKEWVSDTGIFKLTYKGDLQSVNKYNRTMFFGFVMSD